jgi:hypothetical protein
MGKLKPRVRRVELDRASLALRGSLTTSQRSNAVGNDVALARVLPLAVNGRRLPTAATARRCLQTSKRTPK